MNQDVFESGTNLPETVILWNSSRLRSVLSTCPHWVASRSLLCLLNWSSGTFSVPWPYVQMYSSFGRPCSGAVPRPDADIAATSTRTSNVSGTNAQRRRRGWGTAVAGEGAPWGRPLREGICADESRRTARQAQRACAVAFSRRCFSPNTAPRLLHVPSDRPRSRPPHEPNLHPRGRRPWAWWPTARCRVRAYWFQDATCSVTGGWRGLGLELRATARRGGRVAVCARDAKNSTRLYDLYGPRRPRCRRTVRRHPCRTGARRRRRRPQPARPHRRAGQQRRHHRRRPAGDETIQDFEAACGRTSGPACTPR